MDDRVVLIIEDEPGVQELLKVIVERTVGGRAIVAADGEMGLRLAQEASPNLIILNQDMPKLVGLEVVRRLKADLATWTIPVIMATAYGNLRSEALAVGCVDYIQKPFALGQLAAMVRKHLPSAGRSAIAEDMAWQTLLAILKRIHDDLAFRRRYEQAPEAVLAEYPELAEEERRTLIAWPSRWIEEYSVQPCPRCGAEAVVTRTGEAVLCPNCQPQSSPCGCDCR